MSVTEAEWWKCDEPTRLIGAARDSASRRTVLLFVVACWRMSRPLLRIPQVANWITMAEGYADGEVNPPWFRFARSACDRLSGSIGADERADPAFRRRVDAVAVVNWAYGIGPDIDLATLALDVFTPSDRGSAQERMHAICSLVRCILCPFRSVALDPTWRTEAVVGLAAGIYADRAFDRLPILADALDDAGCANADVLAHCRSAGPHARGCWVVDLLLGKG